MDKKGIINHEGDLEVVYPGGYDESELIDLPEDFLSRGWYKCVNHAIVDDLDSWREYVRSTANSKMERETYFEGCMTPKGRIDCDDGSRQILYAIKFQMLIDPNYTVEFKLMDNSTVMCHSSDIDGMISSIRGQDEAVHTKYSDIKSQADNSSEIIPDLL